MSEEQKPQVSLDLRKIYIQDLSAEVPSAPEIFNDRLNPEVSFGLQHDHKALKEKNFYAVNLHFKVEAKDEEGKGRTIYLIELTQTGIFEIQGLSPEELEHALNVYCTATIYPYAREAISSAISHVGFPPIFLQPINFDALYQQKLRQNAPKGKA